MDYISGWCKSERRLDGYTIIVTGSNTGIGKETAADFYKRGARVIMACRNVNNGEETLKEITREYDSIEKVGSLVVEYINLCSLKSIRQFVYRVLEREQKIQILVNNAGVMMCPESKTEDGFETHFGSNHLGHAYLTLLLLPRLIKSAPSRIVFVSSLLHCVYSEDFEDVNFDKTPYSALFAYSASKIANIMFGKALALRLKNNNINNVTTYSVHPGVIRTGINRHFDKTAWFLINPFYKNTLTSWLWKSPRCGAQTSIYCAVDEACENESGLYYSDCAPAKTSSQCQDEKKVTKLYNLTIDMLKLNNYDAFGCNDHVEELFH